MSKVFKAQRFVYCDVHHRSLLNRSGICDGINRCNIFFVHAAVLSIKTAFNLVKNIYYSVLYHWFSEA